MSKVFETEWIFEAFSSELSFFKKRMFGSLAAYLDGKIVAVISESEKEPEWNGFLIPTEFEHHSQLLKSFPFLSPHQILKKWLFLPSSDPYFEERAIKISQRIALRDPLFGVTPKPKKPKGKKL